MCVFCSRSKCGFRVQRDSRYSVHTVSEADFLAGILVHLKSNEVFLSAWRDAQNSYAAVAPAATPSVTWLNIAGTIVAMSKPKSTNADTWMLLSKLLEKPLLVQTNQVRLRFVCHVLTYTQVSQRRVSHADEVNLKCLGIVPRRLVLADDRRSFEVGGDHR